MRVLIAPDKFKGTLTAGQAAAAIARGWKRVRSRDRLTLLPISDGGDGFGEVLAGFNKARRTRTVAVDAAGRRCFASWWWHAVGQTAVIESARVIGLAMLPPGLFHPFDLDSRGLAALLRAAARRGARRCLVGIGGSATNDGGFGLATALGWKFLDRHGSPICNWVGLSKLTSITPPEKRVWPCRMTVAVDVQNPLLGPRGCTRVYGPQKGLQAGDFPQAEASLLRLAKVVREAMGRDIAAEPGAGAAGGLGFGLVAFAGAKLEPGFDLVAGAANLDRQLQCTDWVVTGEGRLDRSSLMGKGTGELAKRCRLRMKPCVALAGEIMDRAAMHAKFHMLDSMKDVISVNEAKARASFWLARRAAAVAKALQSI